MKLLWVTKIPPPYRVDFFNEFGKFCDLTELFEKSGAIDRDDSRQDCTVENFKVISMRRLSYSADSALCLGVLRHLSRGTYDEVIVSTFSCPTGALSIAYLKATGHHYYLESDGNFPSGPRLMSWVQRLARALSGYAANPPFRGEIILAIELMTRRHAHWLLLGVGLGAK